MLTERKGILVRAISSAACMVLGNHPKCIGIRGWTEAGNFARILKIPAIIFGPGLIGAGHSQNEYIELKQIYSAAKIYETFIKVYCNSSQ